MSKLYYFGYYTNNDNPNNFKIFSGCNIKMSYLIRCLKLNNFKVNVICLGESNTSKLSKKRVIDNLETNYYVATVRGKIFARIFLITQLGFILLTKVNNEDIVIFYHTYHLLPLFKLAKKLKKFTLIIEVEESYQAVWDKGITKIKKELNNLKGADGYIYVNDILPLKIDNKSPYVVCYGNYLVSNILKNFVGYTNKDTTIKLVYAGLINLEGDSDVLLAIDAMKYLPKNYELSVAGYCAEETATQLKLYISNNKLTHRVFYDGFFEGKEYGNYLNKFDIGLNPRKLEDKLSNYTFPSKVMTYLTHNLCVVSTPIQCISNSNVNDLVSMSKSNLPKDFANAILEVKVNKDSQKRIKNLDEQFIKQLQELIQNASD